MKPSPPPRPLFLAHGAEERYGRLVVVEHLGGRRRLCRCDCGAEKTVDAGNLRMGRTTSCGCLNRERSAQRAVARSTSHGHYAAGHASPTYLSWQSMKTRCTNPRHEGWSYYGGRGITVCARWADSFEAFLHDMGERPDGKTIDRLDVDGNYEPGNCRWATALEQRANQRVA